MSKTAPPPSRRSRLAPEEIGARIEAAAKTHAWLVAELGGEVVGFAYAGPHRARPAYRWAVDVSVYVDAAHHGEGVGRALYEALFEELRARGFRTACAGITLPNEASVALHERLGFEPVGVYGRIGWKAGRLARRRLVAAGPGAGRGGPAGRAAPDRPPPDPLPFGPCQITRQPRSPRTT